MTCEFNFFFTCLFVSAQFLTCYNNQMKLVWKENFSDGGFGEFKSFVLEDILMFSVQTMQNSSREDIWEKLEHNKNKAQNIFLLYFLFYLKFTVSLRTQHVPPPCFTHVCVLFAKRLASIMYECRKDISFLSCLFSLCLPPKTLVCGGAVLTPQNINRPVTVSFTSLF